ncbi:hypothetical protein QQS21_010471 [Conoideocrella luteorostrata]|uniref:FAD-binding PCMH-type domain-containing protein n=1 Tax=Conoideocrella luteorostrata TaxID=1105319 RepID=A0AAJ0CHM6_9HYPO|nr:hypothetical protein QQS21_010471 [Conoideocrella luteorostrata]
MRARPYTLAVALAGTASTSTSCCNQIRHHLPSLTSFPGSAHYNTTESSYWSLQESDLQPACIIHPTSSQHVSQVMSVVSKDPDCLFAIKGRGHSPAAGFANIQGGVTVDMTGLSNVQVAPDHAVAQVGAGADWLHVYQALEPLGVAVAGGRNGLVGVGGLLLGGGISHFTTKVGWACDNVVNYEIVLSCGKIIQSNASHHSALFHALRGSATNFGIITRFDLKTFPQSNISITSLAHDISHRHAVFGAFTDIITATPFDENVSLVSGLLFNSSSRQWSLTNSAVYAEPVSHPAVYGNLSSVPSLRNSTTVMSLAKFADEKDTPPLNWLFATATLRPSSAFMAEMFDILNETLYEFNPPAGIVWNVALEPLAGRMLHTGETLGMRTTEKGYIVLLSALWPAAKSRERVDSVARDVLCRIEDAARRKDLLQRFQYLNYAAPYQKPLQSYGFDNFDFLKQVSHEYDKHVVFQKQLRGGYKVV